MRRFWWSLWLGAGVVYGDSWLLDAVDVGSVAAVQELAAAGEDVNLANGYGVRPLELACAKGDVELVRVLLENGAKIEQEKGEPDLVTAARGGYAEVVDVLLKNGSSPNVRGGSQTALMWASAGGHEEVVDLLLGAKVDYGAVAGRKGFDALYFAVRAGHEGVVERLVAAGADFKRAYRPDKAGGKLVGPGTSLLLVAVENAHFELALRLIEMGEDPNDLRAGFSALHALTWVRKPQRGDGASGAPPPRVAGRMGSLDFAKELVRAGAEVNLALKHGRRNSGRLNFRGATPFLLAAQTCDLEYMKLLVSLGADAMMMNVEESSALIAAAGLGVTAPGEEAALDGDVIPVVKYLLELGHDVNGVDKNGESVMHAAAYKGDPELVFLLDELGADPEIWNRKNRDKRLPITIAHGFRQGNFRPFQYMIDAFGEVMRKHGLEVPERPMGPGSKKKGY